MPTDDKFSLSQEFVTGVTSMPDNGPEVIGATMTTLDSKALKPCPFCGGNGKRNTDHDPDGYGVFLYIECGGCMAECGRKYMSTSANVDAQAWEETEECWQMRALPHSPEVVAAIEAGISGIECEDGEDYFHKDDPQGSKLNARKAERNAHIAILRTLLPPAPGATHHD